MPKRSKQEPATTHYIPEGHTRANLTSLAKTERLMTLHMGGIFPEQPDPTIFHRVLDIGCGSGSWVIDAALMYPTLSLVGIDSDTYTITYAHVEAETAHVTERVAFHTMDALSTLAFPDASFDLVNLRLGSSFVRAWEWSNLLKEIMRVTQPGGMIRLVEMELISQSSSAAILEVGQLLASAFFHSGHFFDPAVTGLTAHLEDLLRLQGCQQIQTKEVRSVTHSGTADREWFLAQTIHLLPLMQSFIQKWNGEKAKEYAHLCQRVLTDMQQDATFFTQMHFVIVWGIKQEPTSE